MRKPWKYKRHRPSENTEARLAIEQSDKRVIRHAGHGIITRAKARTEKAGFRHVQSQRVFVDASARVFSSQQSPGIVRSKAWMRHDR